MTKSKYLKLKDGDGFEVSSKDGGVLYFSCCDCGLVHRLVVEPVNLKIKIIRAHLFRENRRTAAVRRVRHITVKINDPT